jgi:serine/threonine-protein kinase
MKISIYNVNDEPIGRGGMGQVYLGADPDGNTVAIKEMLAEFVTDADLRRRFHQEVSILNQLEHQSIVKMYASFEERGNLYLVMEYVEGETIKQYVKRQGAIPESKAIRLLVDILSALGYAPRQGYVHRDIKPSNIMIRPNGKVCLLDFGIAKDMNRSQRLTFMQMSLGTHGYMSPEQADGYDIDTRSDIYSLGCVLFYMLTGRHAIEEQENDYKTCMAILNHSFPKVKTCNPDLSDNIQRILDKATDKNMLLRFQSCREFELELERDAGTSVRGGRNAVNNMISVGRTGCDIGLPSFHTVVSGHHLDIVREQASEGELYRFLDRSTNGTVIDGEKFRNGEKTCPVHHLRKYRPSILLAGEVELKWEDIEAAFAKKQGTAQLHTAPAIPEHQDIPPPFEPTDKEIKKSKRNEAVKELLYGFLLLAAGILISIIVSAGSNNYYYVATGVIVIGAFYFIKGTVKCIKEFLF